MAGEGIKLTAKVTNKSGTNKGLQLEGEEGWFSVPEKLKGFMEKINKGDIVEVTYIKKGVFKNVVYLGTGAVNETKKEEQPPECTTQTASTPIKGTKFSCSICGAELKDGKYKKCFNCNKKAKETSTEDKGDAPGTASGTKVFDEPEKEKEGWKPGGKFYGSEEDIAGKEVGCAANCAASILAGRTESPDTLLELWRILFNGILEHIRGNK